MSAAAHEVTIRVGDLPVCVRTRDADFRRMLEERYAGFLGGDARAAVDLDVDLMPPSQGSLDDEVTVTRGPQGWLLRRGDFRAQYDPARRRARACHRPNPYSLDSILRILHSILLAEEGGFLLHAASAVRQGKALLFAGVSGSGKTTLSRLAPPSVTTLSDEISYVRKTPAGYRAFGTPFFGELARGGANVAAQVAALYFLEHGSENRVWPVSEREALERLLRHILFFAREPRLVGKIFAAACDFLAAVPASRLTFLPDERVWSVLP